MAAIEKELIDHQIKEPPQPADFTQAVARAHHRAGLAFPLNGPWTSKKSELVSGRAEALVGVRFDIAHSAAEHFGPESDEAHALEIFAQIAPFLDRIFAAQLTHFARSPLSWRQADGESTLQLSDAIKKILSDETHQNFFAGNPHFAQVLMLLDSHLLDENRPENLDTLPRIFLQKAFEAYRQNKPMLIIALTDPFVNPDGFTEEHFQILESRAQLFFPVSQDRRDQVAVISEAVWQEYGRFSGQNISPTPLLCAIGRPVGWAGSELISYTTGENHFHMGVILADNENKGHRLLRILEQRSGMNAENNSHYQLFFLLLHELGHEFYPVTENALSEIATDLPTIINGLNLIRSKSQAVAGYNIEDVRRFLTIVLFEASRQTLYPNDGDAMDIPYDFSSYGVLNEFFDNGIIDLHPDNESIVWNLDDSTIEKFIQHLTALHRELLTDSSKLRHANITVSEKTQAFINSLSRWQSEAESAL